ncbi:MAG TPA: nickel-binding protein, partial [Flavitalea sp.]|nr:nickel-binding protein [Flavitalea sp.]
MPLYMDLHRGLKGVRREDVEHAHHLDEQVQDKYGVKYQKFWMNEEAGTLFCLIEGPNKEACAKVHEEARGMLACEIIEVHSSDFATIMGEGIPNPTGIAVHPDGKLDAAIRTFLFTDIVNSTSLTDQYGDIVSMTILRKHNEIVRNSLQVHAGTEVKHTGDGIMATFMTSSKALHCALQIQRDLVDYREKNQNSALHVRIGINAGEPVTEGNDFFGAAVQLTKRICDIAGSDQILISDIVKGLCMGRSFQFEELAAVKLKGFSQPVKTFL